MDSEHINKEVSDHGKCHMETRKLPKRGRVTGHVQVYKGLQ